MNQGVRKISFISITKRLDETDRDLRLTKIGSALFEILRQWKWTKVLVYGIYWGIFFFTCNVVISKFTVLFLSWLIVELESLSLVLISIIFFVTGFTMFMLPPVPGIPVYLSSGTCSRATQIRRNPLAIFDFSYLRPPRAFCTLLAACVLFLSRDNSSCSGRRHVR